MISDVERDTYICSKASLPKNTMLLVQRTVSIHQGYVPTSSKMKAARIVFALCALPFAFAKVGDQCTYKDLKGTCKDVSGCTAGKKFHISGVDEKEKKKASHSLIFSLSSNFRIHCQQLLPK